MASASLNTKPHRHPRASDYLIASKRCELGNLERFLQMGKLILSAGNLIHRLQRERGASNVFLGSGGTRFSGELEAMIRDSDQQQTAFERELMEIQGELTLHPTSTSLLNSIAAALHGLESMPDLRHGIRRLEISAETAIHAYIDRIRHLLTVVFDAAETVVDPAIAGMLVALVNLMQGKELAGQERAWGALGFSRGRFDPALSRRITHLIDAQEQSFVVFGQFAVPDLLALWKGHHLEPYWQELQPLRGLACSAGRYRPLDAKLAEQWFALMTRRIDQLKDMEDRMEDHFHRRCIERYTEARNALAHEEKLTESLDESGYAPQPVLVICGTSHPDRAGNFTHSEAGRILGRSIMDLVRQQARRLDQVNQELNRSREALEDRRAIGKAAELLMQHQQVGEDEAHKQLRKLAMDQGRKLPEVARSVISMSGLLR